MGREGYLKEWHIAVVCQMCKNERRGSGNYRGVSLLSLLRKFFFQYFGSYTE